jgi:hypothetical protein
MITQPWKTVASAKVAYVPTGIKTNKKGEEITVFQRIGYRLDMADNSWWFYSFRGKSWTRHWQGLDKGPYFTAPPVTVDRKIPYNNRELRENPSLLSMLEGGVALALANEKLKRQR